MAVSHTRRYRQFIKDLLLARGEQCEVCGDPARHPHHLLPIRKTGINSELAFEPGNCLILCDYCHKMFHPGLRNYIWEMMGKLRGTTLNRRN